GSELSDDRFIEISPTFNDSENLTKQLLSTNTEFDSVVAFSDLISFRIMSQSKEKLIKNIPVIGFDAISSHLFLPFPYVSIGMVENGWANDAAEIILKKIRGSKKTYQKTIDVTLHTLNV
ncbi:MAG: hypothetical protein IKV88_02105, partial [Clostridia bacterium]|nr:hypothetical protein [Clostridia bacterium]